MTRRRTVLGLSVVVLALGAVVPSYAGEHRPAAGGPGTWVQLSSGGHLESIDDPGVGRFGNQLQVVWTQPSGTKTRLATRVLDAHGVPTGPASTVLTWQSLEEFPAVFAAGGQRVIAFSGLQDISSSLYSKGYGYYATSSDGSTWTVANGTFGASTSNYGSYGSDAIDAGGTPLMVSTPGTTNDVSFHSGFDTLPPTGTDGTTSHIPDCCAYWAGAGYDASDGTSWTAWYSLTYKAGTDGIDVQQIEPTAGPRLHAPLSTTKQGSAWDSLETDQRVQLAGRAGGGLYTAYAVGYPNATKVALWKLGSAAPMLISTPAGAEDIGVARGTGGRVWVFWWDQHTATLHAARTNPAATRIGAACSVRTPHGTTSVWTTAGDGSTGPLDLVVNAGEGSADQLYSTQVLPCLSAHVSPGRVSYAHGGKMTITLSDAGVPVAGATVTYAGSSRTTNDTGQATFSVAKHTAKGKHAISFRRHGYTAGSAAFRVR